MLPQSVDHDLRQRDVAPAVPGLGRLELDAVPGLLERCANLDHLGVEPSVAPGQCQDFAAAHAGEQAGDRPGVHGATAQLVD
jgi:hypothetical protein